MKKLFAILLAVAMVLSLAACAPADTATTTGDTAGQTEQNLKSFTVTVVHSDGTSKVFEYQTEEEYLGAVLVAEGLIQGNEGPYGLEIIEVDGEAAVYETSKAYWALYENGEYAMQGVDTTPVIDGGAYKLEYTRG